ncbi:MAG: MBOAT family protein [Burkholderiaceae bacterium]
MLFNSYQFLVVFLPVVLIGYFALGRWNIGFAAAWLTFASLAFYAYWDTSYIPLLLGSIAFNYFAGTGIAKTLPMSRWRAKCILIGAVSADIALLGYYKYADFFIGNAGRLSGTELELLNIVLPLGISFFTFTQIAFLADAYAGKVRDTRFVHYALFVTYFPHLIAGPILHHGEMIRQFDDPESYRPRRENFEVGLSIFAIGLAKKVLIADTLTPFAGSVFSHPGEVTLLSAWAGVLAYAFQLYFDFSGYCDMAIGLSRLFGIQLPINFNSPYKSASIIEFWRRWHITLSRFLRDYLYIPLGGNSKGVPRRYANLLATMLIGGFWHGAGWTFVIWGALHGLYLVINHGWRALKERMGLPSFGRWGHGLGVAITFLAVCFSWVYFRAPDLATATSIVGAMLGQRGVALPDAIGALLGPARPWLEGLGVEFQLGGGRSFVLSWLSVVGAGLIAFACPNTQQILGHYRPGLGVVPQPARWSWRPTVAWGVGLGLLLAAGLLALTRPSEFLYFQF